NLQLTVPELPGQKVARFIKQYGLSKYDAVILTETKDKADYFEQSVKVGIKHRVEPKKIANMIINKRVDIERIAPKDLVKKIIEKKVGLIISEEQLRRAVEEVLKTNQKAVEDYQKGKTTVIEFLVGKVMTQTKGKANPNQTRKLLLEKLG
ncbi:MAG: aspartyl-tRNA(Asn)/glutamyl-tRNA (Gln) amidotransferase subunit B, partial [Microgenomates group bacterium LiPW_31]